MDNVIQTGSHKRQIEYGNIVCLNAVICQNLKRKPHFNIIPFGKELVPHSFTHI